MSKDTEFAYAVSFRYVGCGVTPGHSRPVSSSRFCRVWNSMEVGGKRLLTALAIRTKDTAHHEYGPAVSSREVKPL